MKIFVSYSFLFQDKGFVISNSDVTEVRLNYDLCPEGRINKSVNNIKSRSSYRYMY